MKQKHKFSHTGFSLAEVLITLSILGVIAAMTIPTTMVNIQEKITVTKLKKVYAQLNQSFEIAKLEYGTPDEWGLITTTFDRDDDGNMINVNNPSTETLFKILLSGLKSEKIIDGSQQASYLNGPKYNTHQYYRLPDGTVFTSGWILSNNCTSDHGTTTSLQEICGNIRLDLNGAKSPNELGKDQFNFYITKRGIVPMGQPEETNKIPEVYCNPSTNNNDNGSACAAWAIQNGTMPWLHGEYISWN